MKKLTSILALLLICILMLTSCNIDDITGIINPCKHDNPDMIYSVEGREATCQQKGVTEGLKCAVCGTMVVPQVFIEKTDCKESDWIVTKQPTQTTDGSRMTQCVYCGKVIREEVIPAGTINDENPPACTDHADANEDYICDNCGAELERPVVPVEHEYKLGMGISVDYQTYSSGGFTINGALAAVVLDEQGRIVDCRVDAVYIKGTVYEGGEYQFTNWATKMEMGDNYNMSQYGNDVNGDGKVLEWYQQAQAFEKYVVGKTVDEIRNMPLQFVNYYNISADDALLNAGCTIQITELRDAVVKACSDDQGKKFKTSEQFLLGVAATSNDNGSRDTGDGVDIRTNTDFAATVVVDGKIVASVVDGFQVNLEFDYDGYFTNATYNGTKRELKDDYGCGRFGIDNNGDGINLEWYLQSAAFTNHIVGYTVNDVAAMTTKLSNNHEISTDDELLSAGCTIQITGLRDVVVKSINNARPGSENPDDNTGNGNNENNNGENNNTGDNPVKKTKITIWVSETYGAQELAEQQINRFLANHPEYSNYEINIETMYEADAVTEVIYDFDNAPDIYCFAQDQIVRLVQAGALDAPSRYLDDIMQNNDAASIFASSVNGKVYAYPFTSDNGYYMYYDTSIITNPDSLEQIIADVEAYNTSHPYDQRYIRFNLENAWYMASFFIATGCHSNWSVDDLGNYVSIDDTFNSDMGLVAMKGMQKLAQSSYYNNDNDIIAGAAVVVTGIWNANTAEEYFGENLGATDLPSFTVDGKSYHLGSFSGNRFIGVKPQEDDEKSKFLHDLASYLSGEECQTERYNEFMWTPSNLNVQNSEAVKNNLHISALAKQNQYAVPQGLIHGAWWDIARVLGMDAKAATSEEDLHNALDNYEKNINDLFKEKEKTWSLIGSIMGWMWDFNFPMHKVSDGVWETDVLTFAYGDEFRLRYGESWNYQIGANGEVKWDGISLMEPANIVSVVEGEYIIRLEWDGKSTTATVTFIPAE